MVATQKKNSNPRRTVDLQKLNKTMLRETPLTPSPFDVVSTVPPKTRKTILDMWSSYHSVSLHETTKEAMAFITEWGQYCYCCAPMRFPVSGDAYTRQFDDITSGYLRAVRLVDDSLLWDFNIGSSFWYTFDYLRLSADNRVVFNRDKFQFAQEDVSFAGFEMTREGYKPFKKIITAIKEFPVPTCITVSRKPTIIYFCQGTHHGTVLPAIVCKNIYLRLHFRRTLQKIQGGDR